MADREKVTLGLECCICPRLLDCKKCPYEKICTHDGADNVLLKDALTVILEHIADYDNGFHDGYKQALSEMPEQKKGHWFISNQTNIYGATKITCSNCNDSVMVQNIKDELFCRHCGADMRTVVDR